MSGNLPSEKSGLSAVGETASRYGVFLSYSRYDAKQAQALQRRLERYRTPRKLVGGKSPYGPVPAKLGPVFLDTSELPASQDLTEAIQKALRQSGALVVVCSPYAAASKWVNAEVSYFASRESGRPTLCYIVGGEPNASNTQGHGLPECLPAALRLPGREPNYSDARIRGRAVNEAFIKLVAGILGVGLDDLRRRERKRTIVRRTAQVAGAAALSLLATLAGVQLYDAERAAAADRWADRSRLALEHDRRAAILLAAEAAGIRPTRGVQTALLAALSGLLAPIAFLADSDFERVGDRDFADQIAVSAGGRLLVSRHSSGRVVLRDSNPADSSKSLRPTAGDMTVIALSPDGAHLAVGTKAGDIELTWTGDTEHAIQLRAGHQRDVTSLAFSHDSQFLASGGEDGRVCLWHAIRESNAAPGVTAEWRPVSQAIPQIEGEVLALAFSADGRLLAYGGEDGKVRVWDLARNRLRYGPLPAHAHPLRSLAFNLDASLLASGGEDPAILLWQLRDGEATKHELLGQAGNVLALSFEPNSSMLRSVAVPFQLVEWDVTRPDAPVPRRIDIADWRLIISSTFTDNGALVTGRLDGSLVVWSFRGVERLQPRFETAAAVVAFHPKSAGRLAIAGGDGVVRLREAGEKGFRELRSFPDSSISALTWAPGGTALAFSAWSVSSGSGSTYIMDLTSGKAQAVEQLRGAQVLDLKFSRDAKKLGAVTTGELVLVELQDANRSTRRTTTGGGVLSALAFSPIADLLAIASWDTKVRLWDLREAEPREFGEHLGPVYSVSFSPDGRALASGSRESAIVWNVVNAVSQTPLTLDSACDPLQRFNCVTAVAFAPDGKTLAYPSGGGEVVLVDVPTNKPFGVLRGHQSGVRSVSFSADGVELASAGRDGVVMTSLDTNGWREQACAVVDRNFSCREWAQHFPGAAYRPICANRPHPDSC